MGNGQSDMRDHANVLVCGMKQSGKKEILKGLSELFANGDSERQEAYGSGKTVGLRTIDCDGMNLQMGRAPLDDMRDGAVWSPSCSPPTLSILLMGRVAGLHQTEYVHANQTS